MAPKLFICKNVEGKIAKTKDRLSYIMTEQISEKNVRSNIVAVREKDVVLCGLFVAIFLSFELV